MDEFLEWTGTGGVTHIVDIDGSIWEGFRVALQPAFYFVKSQDERHVPPGRFWSDHIGPHRRDSRASPGADFVA